MDGERHVLIGFAESLSAPEVAWSLVDAGYLVTAFTRRGARPALRRARGVGLIEVTPPETDAAATVRELVSLSGKLEDTRLMPLDDYSVWLCARAAERGVGVAGPSGANADLALDKQLQVEAARNAGLATPTTRVVETVGELLEMQQFPVVLKPALAARAVDTRLDRGPTFICANRAELEAAAGRWDGGERLLVQPWISGTGEGVFGIRVDGAVTAWSAHRRIRMMNPAGSGSSACRSSPVDPALAEGIELMLQQVRWEGMFMVEFLRDGDGRQWFMELNGRAWGSMALARRLGLEYPAWAAATAFGLPYAAPASANGHSAVVCRHLGRELVHLAMVIRGPQSAALVDWPGRGRTAAEVLRLRRGDSWYNLRSGELGVFASDTWETVRTHAARLLGRG